MVRFLLKLIPVFVTAFAILTISARALGILQPPNPVLAGFTEGCEDQPQPCWYGIVPGLTTRSEAGVVLQTIGYKRGPSLERYGGAYTDSFTAQLPSCYLVNLSINQTSLVEGLVISCANLLLGDVASQFGVPLHVLDLNTYRPTLWFRDIIEARTGDVEAWTSFYNPAVALALGARTLTRGGDHPPVDWHGVARRWRYCRVEYMPFYCFDFPH